MKRALVASPAPASELGKETDNRGIAVADRVALELLSSQAMRWKSAWLLLLAGCDQGAPPFDGLPLRDALRAAPAVLAALSDAARARLTERFEAARSGDVAVDAIAEDPSATPQGALLAVDRARQRRQAEPLLLGVLRQGAAWSILGDDPASDQPLPPLEGPAATTTMDSEARALTGHAGAELRLLIQASGAQHLERVVGWPSGAVAIEDTVYVNAAWLVALAPVQPPSLDGGLAGANTPSSATRTAAAPTPSSTPPSIPPSTSSSTSSSVPAPASAISQATAPVADRPGPRFTADAGVPPRVTQPSTEPSTPVSTDGCEACADGCASSDGDGCEGGDTSDADDGSGYDGGDGCETTSSATSTDGSDACASSESDGSESCASDGGDVDGSGCQVGPRPRGRRAHSSAWLLAPLGYLFYRRRP